MARSRRQAESSALNSVVTLPGREALQEACELAVSGRAWRQVVVEAQKYRKRKLPLEVIAPAMVNLVTGRLPSILELRDRLKAGELGDLGPVEVSRSSIYERLESLPHDYARQLLCLVSQELDRQTPYRLESVARLAPFASGIFALDDTTLEALVRNIKELKDAAPGAMATLAGRLACALDLVTGRFREVLYDRDAAANEQTHLIPLVECLPVGAMLVFDLGYRAFQLYDALTDHFCYFVTRFPDDFSHTVVETLRRSDNVRESIIEFGIYRSDRTKYRYRLVEIRIDKKWFRYLTNVLSPKLLPAQNVWGLYFFRWSIEPAFAVLKRCLHLAYIKASNANAVLWQIWCTLMVFQVLGCLRLQIAAKAGWHPDEVSWEMLMRRIGWYAERERTVSLVPWLLDNIDKLSLQKRGVRKRRMTELPQALLDEMKQHQPDEPDAYAQLRVERYGHSKGYKPIRYRAFAGLSRLSGQR